MYDGGGRALKRREGVLALGFHQLKGTVRIVSRTGKASKRCCGQLWVQQLRPLPKRGQARFLGIGALATHRAT